MLTVNAYSDLFGNLAFFVALIATGPCGGGSVAAIRQGGRFNVFLGMLGIIWVFLTIGLCMCQALGVTNL
jgi:hypothetical protein